MKISVSEKHGVNPSIAKCYFCQGDKNEILLLGRLPGDAKAPKTAIYDMKPCDNCQKAMAMGIILISVRDGEMEQVEKDRQAWLAEFRGDKSRPYMPNPYRTGGWLVVKDEAVARFVTVPDTLTAILKQRMTFVPDAAWDAIGLPRTDAQSEALGARMLKPGEKL